jgi:cyclophilin family peptidyl-prolyl cis-trans isomerase
MYKFLIPLFVLAILVGCTSQTNTGINEGYSTSSIGSLPSAVSSTQAMTASSADSSIKLLSGKHTVVLHTSQGDITLELNADIAPKTVTNFVTLSKQGYYDNLTFHRVIPSFMIQGGDPSGNGTGGHSIFGDEFDDEIDAASATYKTGYKKGVIAMANRGPNTNGSQFFIMEKDYPLPPNYTIFGHVTVGQNVVSKIAAVERDGSDRPLTPVTFKPEVKS